VVVVVVMAMVVIGQGGEERLLDSLHIINVGFELDDISIKCRWYLLSGWRLKVGHYYIPLHL
jgi:hypothetical protein